MMGTGGRTLRWGGMGRVDQCGRRGPPQAPPGDLVPLALLLVDLKFNQLPLSPSGIYLASDAMDRW